MKSITFLFFLMLMMTETFFAQAPPIEPGVSLALAKWRAANYSDVRYKLNIALEKQVPLMRGTIEIRLNLTEEGAKNPLVLDWRTTQFTNDKDKPFANVVGVNDAMDILAQINNEHILIPNGLLKTGENVIKIQFASPIKTSGAAITRYVDKEDGAEYVYSLFVPSDASTAFPVFDQPDLKARFSLEITAPENWEVVSNAKHKSNYEPVVQVSERKMSQGKMTLPKNYEENSKKGLLTTEFEETKPISAYVFAFAAGQFQTYFFPDAIGKNKLPSTIYVRQSQSKKMDDHIVDVSTLNEKGIRYLESYFDYKFPFPKYDLVLIPEFPFGGMEHAGATFLRESSVIFPTEPTKNDYVSRANVIFHEAAHQWFGDTVTMKWFDDLWLKEGFAEFMAYKTLSKVMPEYNAWKIFYERNKQAAYLTDSTKGTTPIYQEIANLSAAKSAYGNIVYRKAPSFLKQAEFFLGEDKFQTAVRAFLKKHEFKNAEWTDLVEEFGEVEVTELKSRDYYQKILSEQEKKSAESQTRKETNDWANVWVKTRGVFKFYLQREPFGKDENGKNSTGDYALTPTYKTDFPENNGVILLTKFKALIIYKDGTRSVESFEIVSDKILNPDVLIIKDTVAIFPNYQDYGYGIFLLDEKSRDYVLKNISAEKDDFLRTMMWGALWDSVREGELDPKDYVNLVIKNLAVESDESTIQTLLNRVSTAMNYYLSVPPAVAGALSVPPAVAGGSIAATKSSKRKINPPATAGGSDLSTRIEAMLIERIANAATPGQRITFYRAFLNLASSGRAAQILKDILTGKSKVAVFNLKTKDKFDIVTRLLILGDKDAPQLLANLEKTEPSDEAKRYAYAARAGIGTAETKAKYFKDFVKNKDISESWIEAAVNPFNSPKHSDLTLQYLETALAELPNLKKNRKIFFVNGWLGAFIGGQRSEEALAIVNKFLTDNPNLDKDLRLKILENADGLERAVKIRGKYGK